MRFLPLLAALLLGACAGRQGGTGAQSCTVEKAAEIPVSLERGFVHAPARIDDKPVTLLIDSGAESSMVTPEAMARLGLRPDPRRRTTIRGTGGSVTTQNASLQSLGIGGMEMLDQSASVGRLPNLHGGGTQAAGLLGADWLKDFDVELDLPNRRVALYRVQGCEGDYVPWTGLKEAEPVRIYGHGLVMLPVELDGKPVTAMLDSGANASLLGESAARRIGVAVPARAQDRGARSVGVDGTERALRAHRFTEMRIGALHYRNPLILTGPLALPMADMLLGADWMRSTRLWISYARRQVTIQPVAVRTAETAPASGRTSPSQIHAE